MKFRYVAKQEGGRTISDVINASTKQEARKKLVDKKLSIISLNPVHKKSRASFTHITIGGWVRRMDIVLFTKNLSIMIKSGLTVSEALSISVSQASGGLKKILNKVLTSVEEGNTLADSFAKYPRHFKNMFTEIIALGEKGGNLEENLAHLSLQMEKEIILKRKIKTTLIYPIFILFSTVGLGVILATFVLPRLSKLFSSLGMDLPWSTRVILWIAELFENYGIWVGVGLAAFIALTIFILRLKIVQPLIDFVLLYMPITGRVVHVYNLARFTRNLGVLLQSGLPINDALQAIEHAIDNTIYKRSLRKTLVAIEKGTSLSEALKKHHNLFPPMVYRMINVGEKSGSLEEILLFLAKFYEDEVDNITRNLSSIIEPILLIFIGLIVGFVGVSIITPIYQITGSITVSR